MTTTYQISDKRGDAILLVKTEGGGPDSFGEFAAAVQEAGLDSSFQNFQAVSSVGDPLAAAQRTVQAAFPGAQVVQQAPPQQAQWGNPPVQPYQPGGAPVSTSAPQMPAAAAPAGQSCQHGPKTYKSGTTNGRDWAFWGCNARSDDPTKCAKQWA